MYEDAELEEGAAILIRGRNGRDPVSFMGERMTAATQLLEAVEKAASAAGYKCGTDRAFHVVAHASYGAAYLTVTDDGLFIATRQDAYQDRWTPIERIEFDPSENKFVGIEEDTYHHPNPGAVKARRSAVGIACEQINKMIDAQKK